MVRGETKMHPARCQLLFCTLGVLLRRLIAQGSEEMFSSNDMTHLVLDEAIETGHKRKEWEHAQK